MRKDELLHLHQLLAAVRRDVEARGDAAETDFERYDDLSVSPVAAYAARAAHEEAVRELAAALAERLGDGRPAPQVADD